MEIEEFNDTTLWQQNHTSSVNWCSKCSEITNDDSTFCTCTKDPFDAVDVFKEVPYLRLTLATYFICIVFGALGNLITLFTMATADRKNKTGTNIFLISLSIADLLLVFIAGPMEIVQYLAREFVNSGACKIAEYSRVLSGVASILNLLAVTTERFIVIVFPMKSRSLCTMTNLRRSLVVVWGLSLLLAAPVIWTKSIYSVHYGNNETLLTVSYCNDFDDNLGYIFTIYQLVVCFAVPALFMIIGYSVVIRVLWKSNKNMSLMTNNTASARNRALNRNFTNNTVNTNEAFKSPMLGSKNTAANHQKKQADDVKATRKQVIKMLICVVILFLLCWGPRFIMELLMKMQFSWLYYEHVYVIRIILFLLPMVHAILNPVVYFVMSRNFRQSVVDKCTKGCCRKLTNQQPAGSFEDLEMRQQRKTPPLNGNSTICSQHQNTTLMVAAPKLGASQHELVVVTANGEVAVDLIEQCPDIA